MIIDHHVQCPMRDGVLLSADIYRPDSGGRCTTVLTRSCYTKVAKAFGGNQDRAKFWTANGYVYMTQDVRGRGDSSGTFYPLRHETEDGSDTIDWIASQSWSDGRVVMIGGSYPGWTQLYAACSRNSKLIALVPMVTPADPDRGFPLSYGMIMPAAGAWLAFLDGHTNQELNGDDLDRAYKHQPTFDFDRILGRCLQSWRDWVTHAVRDHYWDSLAYQTRLLETSQHMLHVSGWYDDCLSGALENFSRLIARRYTDAAPLQRLLVGPWLHGTIGQRKIGELDYGEGAEVDLNQLQLEWFNTCLTARNVEEPLATVRLFMMGRNAWIEGTTWPLAHTQYIPFYLHSQGHANTRNGDGALSVEPPLDEPPDKFSYNPAKAVPYSPNVDFKQVGGPDNCAEIELRDDVLVYTGPILEAPLVICGPLRVKLYARTTARDTDWTAKILDVQPDGKAIRLNDGAIRARFRNGHDREEFLRPGEIVHYDIDCWATCIELPVGHRLRLEISSSAFGKYDVNLNGGGPVGRESEPHIADQSVFHNAKYPSHLVLPVLLEQSVQ